MLTAGLRPSMKSTSGLSIWPEELAGVGRERLDVAALALGEDRVEGQARLARPGQPGEDDERVTREVEGDVLEVVLPGAPDDELVGHSGPRSGDMTESNTCSSRSGVAGKSTHRSTLSRATDSGPIVHPAGWTVRCLSKWHDGRVIDVPRPDPDTIARADRALVRTVDALSDPQYAEPSQLPGWTRAHVVAHLALNGEGLAGVLHGAHLGQPQPMYASPEARDADIEELAAAAPDELRERFLAATAPLRRGARGDARGRLGRAASSARPAGPTSRCATSC